MSGARRGLVARAIWEHTFLQARLIAITDFLTFVRDLKARESDKTLLVLLFLKIEHLKKLIEVKKFLMQNYRI